MVPLVHEKFVIVKLGQDEFMTVAMNWKLTKIWSRMLAENMKASPARLNIKYQNINGT